MSLHATCIQASSQSNVVEAVGLDAGPTSLISLITDVSMT